MMMITMIIIIIIIIIIIMIMGERRMIWSLEHNSLLNSVPVLAAYATR